MELRDRGRTLDLLDPPDGGGRGDVRVGRDRRPRPAGRRRPGPRPEAGERSADAPARRSTATWRRRGWPTLPGVDGDPCRRRRRASSSCRRGADPAAILAAIVGRGAASPGSRSPSRPSRRCSSSTSGGPPTTTATARRPRSRRRPLQAGGRRPDGATATRSSRTPGSSPGASTATASASPLFLGSTVVLMAPRRDCSSPSRRSPSATSTARP